MTKRTSKTSILSDKETKFHLSYPTPDGVSVKVVNYSAEDGVLMDAFLFRPSSRAQNDRKTGIVFCHGLRDSGVGSLPSAVGQLLAKSGFAVLSINKRNSSINWEQSKFEDTSGDIKGAIQYLEREGFKEAVLIGHSLGCTELLYHLAHKKEPMVRAVVLIAAPSDIKGKSTLNYFRKFEDPHRAYNDFLMNAKKMVLNGHGDSLLDLLIDLPGNHMHLPTSAKTFLSYRSPDSNCSAKLWIGSIDVPILLIGHETDWTAKEDNEELLNLVRKKTPCKFVMMEKANHYFEGYREELSQTISDWLSKLIP